MSEVDCTRTNLNQQEKNYCNCQEAINNANKLMNIYTTQLTEYAANLSSWTRWNRIHTDWQNREGNFSSYKNHGLSQDFTVQWGWADWDTNNACRECANNKWGWGDGSKMPGGAWCQGQSGKLLGADSYQDSGAWGWHVGGSRKYWTCAKSQNQKNSENQEYYNAEPLFDPQDIARSQNWKSLGKPQTPQPPKIGDILCCSQIFKEIDVTDGNVSFDNISQICGITKIEQPQPTSPPVTQTTPTQTPQEEPLQEEPPQKEDPLFNQTNILISGGVSSILLLISASASFVFLMNKKKE